MGQALSISARGGSIFSRTKYANKDLGVKLDHVVGDDNQRMSARKLNNSIQRKTEAAIYFYGKNTSRSQARAESAPQKKRTNPDRNTRSPATTSASNFPLWMRGVRRCIVEMAMRLVKGDRVVLVLPTGDEGSSTQKTFEEYRIWAANSKSDAKWFYELGGKQYLALPGEVHANNKGSDIVSGIVGESEAIELIQTNDGISIQLDAQNDRPANEKPCRPEVSWLNIIHGDFQIWDYNVRKEPLTDYLSELGVNKSVFCNSETLLQRLFVEIEGDTLSVMNLRCAVEEFKANCSENKRKGSLKRKGNGGDEEAVTKEAIASVLESELTGNLGVKFIKDLEAAASKGLESSFANGWVPTLEPILDVDHWAEELERNLPFNWEATSILVPPSAHEAGQEHRIEDKKQLRFWHFASSLRTRDDHLLPSVAKIVTLASIGRGHSENSQALSVSMRLASPYAVVVRWMKAKFDEFKKKQRATVRACLSLSCAFDNWQKFVRNKFQRGRNAAGEERVGTTRFFRRNFEQEWPPGTILLSSSPEGFDNTVKIVSTKHIDTTHTAIEYQVAPVPLREPFSPRWGVHRFAAEVERERAVTLPSAEWSVTSAPGLAAQPPVVYDGQFVPPPLGMLDYYAEANDEFRRVFSGLPGEGDETEPMDTKKYFEELSLVQTIGYLHRFVSTESLWCTSAGGEAKGEQAAVQEIAGQLRAAMSNITGTYQAKSVKQWNKTIDELALVEWMPMSKFWEMTQVRF